MNPLHDSEKVIGRIRTDGGWDRRYTSPAARKAIIRLRQAERPEPEPKDEGVLKPLAVFALLCFALYSLAIVASGVPS